MPVVLPRQIVTTTTTSSPTVTTRIEPLADSFATLFIPSPTPSTTSSADSSSYSTVIDVWQYLILAFVVFLAACLVGTVFIFRNKAKAARARRAARLAAEAEAANRSDAGDTDDDDDRSTRRSSFASSRRDSEYALEDGEGDELSMVEIRSTRSGVTAPPAYRERPRSAGTETSATVSTSTTAEHPPKVRTLSSRLSRIPSAIGSFLTKRVQPGLGGNNVSTDELQTRAAEAQLEAARTHSRTQSRRASASSSMFAFSPRRASSTPDVYPPASPSRRSRLQSEPPSVETVDQVRQIRRALSDAGLLFAPPRSLSDRRLSGTSAVGSRPAVLATMHEDRQRQDDANEQAEREIYRQERRDRRRRRRERERQRLEDEAGLPTYSRQVAEGDVVLQRADGWKSSEEEGDDEEEADALDALGAAMRMREARTESVSVTTGEPQTLSEEPQSVHSGESEPLPPLST